MKLTSAQKEKLNDFKNAYMQIFNKDNNDYMTLIINTIFDNVEKNYEEFSDEIEKVSVIQENDELNILKPVNGYYSLLDFLLNRVFKNIHKFNFNGGNNGLNMYNAYSGLVTINPNRYDSYYSMGFSDDFLLQQKRKSIMHESCHALENKRECDYFSAESLTIANHLKKILEPKYYINTKFENVSDKVRIPPFDRISILEEGLTEMYASLNSGVLRYSVSDSNLRDAIRNNNVRKDSNGKVTTSLQRNCFNGYKHSKYFYQIRALVSKQSIFNSMYFGKKDMIEEFYEKYRDIINRHELTADISIKNQINCFNGNFFENLLKEIGDLYLTQRGMEDVYKYEKILDSIFLEIFEKEISTLKYKDETLSLTLANMYYDSYSYIENNQLVDSEEKTKYLELYQKVKQKNEILPYKPANLQNESNDNLNNNRVLAYGIFDVNVISNPDHDMKIIVYLKNNEFEVNQIELKDNNDFTIIKEKNSICKLVEKYLNKHKQELIDNPKVITELFNNISTYIPEITISRNSGEYESGSYGIK